MVEEQVGFVRFTLDDFIVARCNGKIPKSLVQLFDSLQTEVGRDIFRMASAIGALEPLASVRPEIGEFAMVFDKTVTIARATTTGTVGTGSYKVIPGEAKLIRICAPMGKALVIETLRALPVNLTAVQSGSLKFKRVNVAGFSEGFCPPGEPADGDDEGTYQNLEHILLRPESGFDLYAENFDTTAEAMVHVSARMWTAC
jgi:hypothetical protein